MPGSQAAVRRPVRTGPEAGARPVPSRTAGHFVGYEAQLHARAVSFMWSVETASGGAGFSLACLSLHQLCLINCVDGTCLTITVHVWARQLTLCTPVVEGHGAADLAVRPLLPTSCASLRVFVLPWPEVCTLRDIHLASALDCSSWTLGCRPLRRWRCWTRSARCTAARSPSFRRIAPSLCSPAAPSASAPPRSMLRCATAASAARPSTAQARAARSRRCRACSRRAHAPPALPCMVNQHRQQGSL